MCLVIYVHAPLSVCLPAWHVNVAAGWYCCVTNKLLHKILNSLFEKRGTWEMGVAARACRAVLWEDMHTLGITITLILQLHTHILNTTVHHESWEYSSGRWCRHRKLLKREMHLAPASRTSPYHYCYWALITVPQECNTSFQSHSLGEGMHEADPSCHGQEVTRAITV